MVGDEIKMNIHKNKMLWYNTGYCIRASYERNWNMGKYLNGKENQIEKNKRISEISTELVAETLMEM